MTSHAISLPGISYRYSGSLVLAGLITVALLWIMQDLIRHRGPVPEAAAATTIVSIVRAIEDVPIKPEDPPKPLVKPEQPPVHRVDIPDVWAGGDTFGTEFAAPDQTPDMAIGNTGLPDGDMLPIVKVAPIYPNRAATRGIEGFVLLEFTVDERGAVLDPRVVESSPSGVFDRSALNAVVRFKYKPRVVNGTAVRVQGVLHRLTFELSGA